MARWLGSATSQQPIVERLGHLFTCTAEWPCMLHVCNSSVITSWVPNFTEMSAVRVWSHDEAFFNSWCWHIDVDKRLITFGLLVETLNAWTLISHPSTFKWTFMLHFIGYHFFTQTVLELVSLLLIWWHTFSQDQILYTWQINADINHPLGYEYAKQIFLITLPAHN